MTFISRWHGVCCGCNAKTSDPNRDHWMQTGHVRIGRHRVLASWCPACQEANRWDARRVNDRGEMSPVDYLAYRELVQSAAASSPARQEP